jgi:hypothetical protein
MKITRRWLFGGVAALAATKLLPTSPALGKPIISGGSVGETLLADGSWSDAPKYAYQWFIDGKPILGVNGAALSEVPMGTRSGAIIHVRTTPLEA